MPELPEVETVRAGLARHVVGRRITGVEVFRTSAVRRHDGGPADFRDRLLGRRLDAAVRRGKYAWLILDGRDESLVWHLGMSGQLLVRGSVEADADVRHLRCRFWLDDGSVLDFVDQRTFGSLAVVDLVPTADGGPGGAGAADPALPSSVAHVARDVLDPIVDHTVLAKQMRTRRSGVKRVLLNQTVVSGVGNIYADEGLWRAKLHYDRPADGLRSVDLRRLLAAVSEVMVEALDVGGTSFDDLYVDVNGASGYFDRSLAVYGQAGRPCPRCGTTVRRDHFMNRSSYSCPRCQRS